MDVVMEAASVIAYKPSETKEQAQERSSGTTLNESRDRSASASKEATTEAPAPTTITPPLHGLAPASTSGLATDTVKAAHAFESGADTTLSGDQPASEVDADAGTSLTTTASTVVFSAAAPPTAPFTFPQPIIVSTPASRPLILPFRTRRPRAKGLHVHLVIWVRRPRAN